MFRRSIFSILMVLVMLVGVIGINIAQDDPRVDIYGRELPEDAADYDQQVMRVMCDATSAANTFSAIVSVYSRISCVQDLLSDSLVVLDNNLSLQPAAAESWVPSEDGLTWTFTLKEGQMWSDGTPLTAYDYEASYQYTANPESGYDFTWMWAGIIANYAEAVAGEVDVTEIGVVAVDDLTLEVTTVFPFPPLPNTLFFWPPLQKAALEEFGPNYILDPETSVSSGPFVLVEFVPGESIVLEANPTYTGYRQPIIRRIEGFFADFDTQFLAYQAGDIEFVSYEFLSPADFEIIAADENLESNYFPNPGDFRTEYLLMDTYSEPFDNVLVRQAFAKALDRENIVANVIGPRLAIPAYSMLSPGFPASDTEGALRDAQAYDCEAAQGLLAEAGYPDGEGFPDLTLQLRGESDAVIPRYIAAAASISECLNINIEVNNLEFTAYMDALLASPTEMTFGGVSYGMDYLDPANMLGTLWTSDGRHSWRNTDFDSIAQEANQLVGDPERRTELYRQAEEILVNDVGGIFLNHRIQGHLFQPYLMGGHRDLNAQGLPGWQWGNDWIWGSWYIGANVADFETHRDS